VLTAVARIFYETVSADYRRRSGALSARTGAVTCVQRFGGSLNLNPHLHVIWLDGVFTFDDGAPRFLPADSPSRSDLERIVRRVAERVVRWLDRKGVLDISGRQEERSNVPETPSTLDACAEVALATGGFGVAASQAADAGDHDDARWSRREQRYAAEHDRFNLHAGVHLPATDIESREKLYRHALRPCFALERLPMLPDGRIAYRVKAPRRPPSYPPAHDASRISGARKRSHTSATISIGSLPWRVRAEFAVPNARGSPSAGPDDCTLSSEVIAQEGRARKERDPDRAPSLRPQHGGETTLPQTPGRLPPAVPTSASGAGGGVVRFRQPSCPQHRLNRRSKVSAALPIRPPRGLRG